MTHKTSDAERRQIRDALEAQNRGDWIKIASEIDYRRNQIYYWLLIKNNSSLRSSAEKFAKTLYPYLAERPGAQFNVGFYELTDEHQILWDTIDDDELRRGTLQRAIGDDPWKKARPKTTVFDRPEYVVPESQEDQD